MRLRRPPGPSPRTLLPLPQLRRALASGEDQVDAESIQPRTECGLTLEAAQLLPGTNENFLRQLFTAGAFKGRRESEAFFVRCDGELNHRRVLDAGQLIVEIGVAPAEPLEFIVVRIVRDGDGTLAVAP